jgi:sugar O-acyltransferase (sialic acid O-acetyltransferase NeuD family)
MAESDPLLVYGAGGMGREVLWLASACGRTVVAFIDDAAGRPSQVLDLPVLTLEQATARYPRVAVVPAIGSSLQRRACVERILAGGHALASLVHPSVIRSPWVTLGQGVVVAAGSILTTNVTVGDNVQINTHCTVAHDVVIDRDATLAPGVHLSGWVHVGPGAQIGTGAVVSNGTQHAPMVIGAEAIVGAGACVVRSVPARTTAVGVPAQPVIRERAER